jgi:hypothetical protein
MGDQQHDAHRDLPRGTWCDTTGKRGAVRNNSGEPVDHSGPGLRVGPTTSVTADRKSEACPPGSDLLSQHKSGRGSGGGAPSGASVASGELRSAATQQVSSLDLLQTHRNGQSARGKHCGRFTIHGTTAHDPEERFHRVNCKTWPCRYCGPRKARRYKHAIRTIAETHKLNRLLTLTLQPSKVEGDAVNYLNQTFAKLRVYLWRRFGVSLQYIRILEFQKSGSPHFHILVDRYIAQRWLSQAWNSVGGGSVVDIRYVDVHRVTNYLSKYLTKELLMSAPSRSRRVTTSRGLHLFEGKRTIQPNECATPEPASTLAGCAAPKENTTRWTLVRVPIFELFRRFRDRALAVICDEEGVLESFSVFATAG